MHFFMLESIASPPYEKVNDFMESLVFDPITQNNSMLRSQIITKDLGNAMLLSGIQSRTGRHGSAVGSPEGMLEHIPNKC